MVNLNERLHEFKQKITNYQTKLIQLEANLKKIDQQNSQIKEQLQDFQTKLLNAQTEKKDIQQELDEKVVELDNSNLTKEEKTEKINELLMATDLINHELIIVWSNYAQKQEKIIDYLIKPCLTCECKLKTIKDLKGMRNWLIGTNSLLLLVVSVFSFYFVYRWWKSKKTQTIKNYELRK